MKDRVVQYPHRYRLVPVSGQSGVYDIVPVPGTVTEVGTALNKGNLLSDETALGLCLSDDEAATVNTALRRANLASFMTFCGADLDAALGKGNESRLFGIGRQLAMYAWFMGETAAFSTLVKCDTLQECYQHAIVEILNSQVITALLNGSAYASERMYTENNVRAWKRSYSVMSDLVAVPTVVDKIRTNCWDVWKNGWQTYTARGGVSFEVPDGVTCLTVEAVGAGGDGGGARYVAGNGGAYQLSVMQVTPGQIIEGNISLDGTLFGDITLGKGGGATGGGGAGSVAAGSTPSQAGKFLKVSVGGGMSSSYYRASGGGGGYGGGSGGYGGYVRASDSSARAPGGAGASVLPITAGTGGTAGKNGYGDMSPAGGSGGGGGGGGVGRVGDNTHFGGGGGGGYGGGGGGYSTNSTNYPAAPGGGGSGCIVIYM